MKNSVLVVLLCVATLLSVYLAFRKEGSSPIISVNMGKSNVAMNDAQNVFFNVYPDLIIPSEGHIIRGDIKLLDTSLKKVELNKIVNAPTLIIRFSNTDCDMCITSVLKLIKEKYEKYLSRVVMITDGYSEKDFVLKAQYLNVGSSIFNLSDETRLLGLPIEKRGLPFLFMLNENMIASNFYCAFKEYPRHLNTYLGHLFEKIERNTHQ